MYENPENREIRKRITDRMEELNINQKTLCDRTGLSKNQVNNITSGERQIHVSDLVPLSNALRCSVSWLLTGREETSSSALEETGLYQTTLNQLQLLKTRPDFDRIRETFDILARYPVFLARLNAYFLQDLDTISLYDKETHQYREYNVTDTDTEPEPVNPDFPRLKYLPAEYYRMQILDWATYIRRKEHQERQETAHSTPSGSPADRKPV